VPCVDARTGLWLTAITDVGVKAADGGELNEKDAASLKLDDNDEQRLYERVLGPACGRSCSTTASTTLLQIIAATRT
jgi:hypothetical protein